MSYNKMVIESGYTLTIAENDSVDIDILDNQGYITGNGNLFTYCSVLVGRSRISDTVYVSCKTPDPFGRDYFHWRFKGYERAFGSLSVTAGQALDIPSALTVYNK